MNIVRADMADFDNLWQRLFQESDFHYPLYQPWNMRYYEAYESETKFEDCSFVIEEKNLPVSGVRITRNELEKGRHSLSCFGLPILYIENQEMPSTQTRGAQKASKAEFDSIRQRYEVGQIGYRDFLRGGSLSFFSKILLNEGARPVPSFTQIINLSVSEADLHCQVRKSYKSLINWGKRELSLRVIDSETVAPEDIERFRKLHIQAAGRETRSQNTWDLQYEMVRHKEAFCVFGELGGELVTAALFPCSPGYCFYGVSASKKDLSDKPLSHAVIWHSIIHAKETGCSFIDLGDQYYPNQCCPLPGEKELSISSFKHGFGGETHARLNIVWKR